MPVKPDYSRQVREDVWDEKKQEHIDFYKLSPVAVGDWVWAEYNMGSYDDDKTLIKWGTPVLRMVHKITPKGFVIEGFITTGLLTVDPETGFSKDKRVRVRLKASAGELAARDQEHAEALARKKAMEDRNAQADYKVASWLTGLGAVSPEQLIEQHGYELLLSVARQLGYKEK